MNTIIIMHKDYTIEWTAKTGTIVTALDGSYIPATRVHRDQVKKVLAL
jgi:hypothetical protein